MKPVKTSKTQPKKNTVATKKLTALATQSTKKSAALSNPAPAREAKKLADKVAKEKAVQDAIAIASEKIRNSLDITPAE